MSNRHTLAELRLNPTEWHRRGMSAPTDIDKLVSARLGYRYTSDTQHTAEPSYADFFVAA
ncbi:hypothetical protein NS263_07895 [Curtobacterium oceanosedimentum]|uniref:Uncharacterized protein n=1 Tax=Curtobacterium oceanosedimentum TaxID=465820 RepID=A0ABR5S6L1_9MICO|nr:hypothetical protein [Curtobacterium oceanosedimentum]KTR40377.1 hypothetical protein NS263_07895 [Curtobacterium oceanosedimentum]